MKIKAVFHKKPSKTASAWSVLSTDDNTEIFRASCGQIEGPNVFENFPKLASKEYGAEILNRIKEKGFVYTAEQLGVLLTESSRAKLVEIDKKAGFEFMNEEVPNTEDTPSMSQETEEVEETESEGDFGDEEGEEESSGEPEEVIEILDEAVEEINEAVEAVVEAVEEIKEEESGESGSPEGGDESSEEILEMFTENEDEGESESEGEETEDEGQEMKMNMPMSTDDKEDESDDEKEKMMYMNQESPEEMECKDYSTAKSDESLEKEANMLDSMPKGKKENEKAYYTKAYGDSGFSSELVKDHGKGGDKNKPNLPAQANLIVAEKEKHIKVLTEKLEAAYGEIDKLRKSAEAMMSEESLRVRAKKSLEVAKGLIEAGLISPSEKEQFIDNTMTLDDAAFSVVASLAKKVCSESMTKTAQSETVGKNNKGTTLVQKAGFTHIPSAPEDKGSADVLSQFWTTSASK